MFRLHVQRHSLVFLAALFLGAVTSAAIAPSFEPDRAGDAERENRYWRRIPLPVPDPVILEVGGILPLPDRTLLVLTRRGEIWRITGAYDDPPRPWYELFAQGLHEPLGLAAAPKGGYYVAQRQEVTRVVDTDDDGRADLFETVATLPISGSYHEYAFGPVMGPDGNLRVALNVAFGGPTQAPVPWRGWLLEIAPDGHVMPIAAGLRSPAGFTYTSQGIWLSTDNQGEWVGSGKVTQIDPGDFLGHQASLTFAKLPGSTVHLRPEQIEGVAEPMSRAAERIPRLKAPAVWFPHAILGISTSDILEDNTGGKFGPFAGQLLVGDQGQSKILRMTLEQTKGVWQGAAYSFREGFESGVLRMAYGLDGSLFVGETSRGWGAAGSKEYGLERLVWTGLVPFEMFELRARPDGFEIKCTEPVDRSSALDLASYRGRSFTYTYHKTYGSPQVKSEDLDIAGVTVSEDGKTIRLKVNNLREGYVHELSASGVKSQGEGKPLLHPTAFYTLNAIPDGAGIDVAQMSTLRTETAKSGDGPIADIQTLLTRSTCTACHSLDQRLIGPSYSDIAKRGYSVERLVALIQRPEPENWPEYPAAMPPMSHLPEADLTTIARWIASLEPSSPGQN